jgi:hypothetical protein
VNEKELLDRLYELLATSGLEHGEVVDPLDEMLADLEVHAVGKSGVAAFFGDYLLAAWPPAERVEATAKTYRLIGERLEERGLIRFMVHLRNVRSIIATRRLGGRPLGVDKDGYIHYLLTREAFANRGRRTGLKIKPREHTGHGQEVTASEAAGSVANL